MIRVAVASAAVALVVVGIAGQSDEAKAQGKDELDFPYTVKFEKVSGGKVVYSADKVGAMIGGTEVKKWVLVKKHLKVTPMKGDRVIDADGNIYTIKSSKSTTFNTRYLLETDPPAPNPKMP